jgi:hypothetical protein
MDSRARRVSQRQAKNAIPDLLGLEKLGDKNQIPDRFADRFGLPRSPSS